MISFGQLLEAIMRVSKWGDSLAVRLPKKLVENLGLAAGDEVDVMSANAKTIMISKSGDKRAEFLKQMEQFRWSAPEDYKFDRDEANER
jgi:antitoxin MazE